MTPLPVALDVWPSTRTVQVPATRLKNAFSEVFDLMQANGAVTVTRHEKPQAVLISVKRYEELVRAQQQPLEKLLAQYQPLFDQMQTPESRAAIDRFFEMDSKELGENALAYYQKNNPN